MNLIKRHKGLAVIGTLTLILLIILFVIFSRMIFPSANSEYGDRLNGMIKLEKETSNKVLEETKKLKEVEDITIRTQGKIIYTTITFTKSTSKSKAKEIANKTLTYYDDEIIAYYDFQYFLTQKIELKEDEEDNKIIPLVFFDEMGLAERSSNNPLKVIHFLLEKDADIQSINERKDIISKGYKTLWTEKGFKSKDVRKPDDRANALADLSGLAEKEQYDTITDVLINTKNSSPYMEYYVLEALCKMGRYEAARDRIKDRYEGMMSEDYSTLWEFWDSWRGTKNHAWSGGPLVIMSKHFAGITPLEAGYEKVKIEPQYNLSDSINCTVPSVKGLITLEYNKSEGDYIIDLTLPQGIKAVLYVPTDAVVKINSEVYYQNGEYVNGGEIVEVEIVEN